MNFYIFEWKNSEYYFSLKTEDDKIVLKSEGYSSKQWVKKAIDSVKSNSEDSDNYDYNKTSEDMFYFNLKAWNWEIIWTSAFYKTEDELDALVLLMKTETINSEITED